MGEIRSAIGGYVIDEVAGVVTESAWDFLGKVNATYYGGSIKLGWIKMKTESTPLVYGILDDAFGGLFEEPEISDYATVMENALDRAGQYGINKFYKVMYHVFTDETDDFFESLNEAWILIHELRGEGANPIRMYIEFYYTEDDWENGRENDEDCLYSLGAYPC
jgi:hypothetical protein